MLANEGMVKNETFCSATPSAMVFGKSDGDRFAVTRDLTLKPGYVLQFKVLLHRSLPRAGQRAEHPPDSYVKLKGHKFFTLSFKEGTHLSKSLTVLDWQSSLFSCAHKEKSWSV